MARCMSNNTLWVWVFSYGLADLFALNLFKIAYTFISAADYFSGKDYEERRGRGRGRGRGRPRGRAKAPPRGLRVKKRNMVKTLAVHYSRVIN